MAFLQGDAFTSRRKRRRIVPTQPRQGADRLPTHGHDGKRGGQTAAPYSPLFHSKEQNMNIRLSKALRELNIGLQTAVEFLEKRSELGEVKPEPSFKLSDAQYNALVAAFQQDKEMRTQAEKLLQKKPKEKKSNKEDNRAERLLPSAKQ